MDKVKPLGLTSRTHIENAEIEIGRNDLTSDGILSEIGGFGIYQILVGIATGVALMLSSFDTFNFVFTSVIPEHRYSRLNSQARLVLILFSHSV